MEKAVGHLYLQFDIRLTPDDSSPWQHPKGSQLI
jgi:hypothetical protein